jgi:hypothetical protein
VGNWECRDVYREKIKASFSREKLGRRLSFEGDIIIDDEDSEPPFKGPSPLLYRVDKDFGRKELSRYNSLESSARRFLFTKRGKYYYRSFILKPLMGNSKDVEIHYILLLDQDYYVVDDAVTCHFDQNIDNAAFSLLEGDWNDQYPWKNLYDN